MALSVKVAFSIRNAVASRVFLGSWSTMGPLTFRPERSQIVTSGLSGKSSSHVDFFSGTNITFTL